MFTFKWTHGPGGIIFQISHMLLYFTTLVIGIRRLVGFWRSVGPMFSVPQMCLGMEVISAIIRVLYVLEPLDFRKDIYNNTARHMLFTIAIPISLSATLLITFYW